MGGSYWSEKSYLLYFLYFEVPIFFTLVFMVLPGVFGAGKSFLLAVVVLFLVKVFDLADSSRPSE